MVAAIIAVAAIGCGVAPDEGVVSYDDNGRNTPTAPAEPTVDTDTDAEVIEDGCEAFGLVYDAANNTCVDDEEEINIIAPPVEEPTVIVDGCEAFGLIEENGTCVEPPTEEPEFETAVWTPDFNFTVTPGPAKLVATWDANDSVSSFVLEYLAEATNYPTKTKYAYPTGTEYTVGTHFCNAYTFTLVATMKDGSEVRTEPTDYLKQTYCE